jgi:hypothetical protein
MTEGFVRAFENKKSVDLWELGLGVDLGLKKEVGYYC